MIRGHDLSVPSTSTAKLSLLPSSFGREHSQTKDGFVTANIYYMHSLQVLRGDIDSNFEIYEGNDSGRAGFDWKKGHAYLLFLRPSVERKVRLGRWMAAVTLEPWSEPIPC
jgi:hypothetical protein